MNTLLILQSIIMGIVEGVTEFLPISSTGHLILTAQLLDFWTEEKRELFEVAVQIGAIAAVIVEYWSKLWNAFLGLVRPRNPQGRKLGINLIVASLPIVCVGLTFGSTIKHYLFNATTVASALIVGGIIILWAERRHKRRASSDHHLAGTPIAPQAGETVDNISFKQALIIGLLQCIALIPGTSRSGTTIVSGLLMGISRKAAAEFSFFLGIPVLMGAGLLDLYKHKDLLNAHDVGILLIGMISAFFSAWIVIRALIKYVSQHDFTIFAWYRIAFGLFILITAAGNWITW